MYIIQNVFIFGTIVLLQTLGDANSVELSKNYAFYDFSNIRPKNYPIFIGCRHIKRY